MNLNIWIKINFLRYFGIIPAISRQHKIQATKNIENKANLRDLAAATGLVILLKLDSNRRFFSWCDLEIWWMTLNKANLRDLIDSWDRPSILT